MKLLKIYSYWKLFIDKNNVKYLGTVWGNETSDNWVISEIFDMDDDGIEMIVKDDILCSYEAINKNISEKLLTHYVNGAVDKLHEIKKELIGNQ